MIGKMLKLFNAYYTFFNIDGSEIFSISSL